MACADAAARDAWVADHVSGEARRREVREKAAAIGDFKALATIEELDAFTRVQSWPEIARERFIRGWRQLRGEAVPSLAPAAVPPPAPEAVPPPAPAAARQSPVVAEQTRPPPAAPQEALRPYRRPCGRSPPPRQSLDGEPTQTAPEDRRFEPLDPSELPAFGAASEDAQTLYEAGSEPARPSLPPGVHVNDKGETIVRVRRPPPPRVAAPRLRPRAGPSRRRSAAALRKPPTEEEVAVVQALIDRTILVRHKGREFPNVFKTADGTQRQQIVATRDGYRCAICGDQNRIPTSWPTKGSQLPARHESNFLDAAKWHTGHIESILGRPHRQRLLALTASSPAPAAAPQTPVLRRSRSASISPGQRSLSPSS